MVWEVCKRVERGICYQDTVDRTRRFYSGTAGKLHMESTEGNGRFDTPIDFSFRRINNAKLNGFRMNGGPFHFAIQTRPPTEIQDARGTISYGGRRGRKFIKMRPHRLGYYHMPSDTFTGLTGAPDFSNFTGSHTSVKRGPKGLEEDFVRGARGGWTDIWPGVDFEARLSNYGLSQDFIVSQATREALPAPTTPANQTWVGILYRLDPGELKFFLKGQRRTELDDDSDDEVELEDQLEVKLGYLQRGIMYVRRKGGRVKLRRKIYRRNGQWWYFYGARVDRVNQNLLAGDIIIDPAITQESIQQGSDDGYEFNNYPNISQNQVYIGRDSADNNPGFRFQTVPVPAGSTINSCSITFYQQGNLKGTPDINFYLELGNAATFTTDADNIEGRTRTTAFTNVNSGWGNNTDLQVTLTSAMQELVDDASWSNNSNVAVIGITQSGSNNNYQTAESLENSGSNEARFDCDYTSESMEQEGFRWRNDDGSESAATWAENQDVNHSVEKNTHRRLRVLMNATGDYASLQATLQFRRVGDADSEWENV